MSRQSYDKQLGDKQALEKIRAWNKMCWERDNKWNREKEKKEKKGRR